MQKNASGFQEPLSVAGKSYMLLKAKTSREIVRVSQASVRPDTHFPFLGTMHPVKTHTMLAPVLQNYIPI